MWDKVTYAVLVACFGIFILFWAVAAFWTKRTVERSPWSWRFVGLVLGLAAYAMSRAGGPLTGVLSRRLWQPGPVTDLITIVLAVSGLAVMLAARVTLGSNWSGSVVFKQNHELITRGPYAHVRHPIYSGLIMMIVGGVLFFGRAWGLVWLAIALVMFVLKARTEERLMTRHFPEAYPAYRARVKALVPYVF